MPADTVALLRTLALHKVDHIVVGMTAGVLQGAPVITLDVDILYARTPTNIARLAAALSEVNARFRGDPRQIVPNVSHLESMGHKLLETDHGDLDVLGTIDESAEYADLLEDTVTVDVEGMKIAVLSLARLIEIKERAGRPKDLAVLPVLRSTLERAQRK
ncbi:MAG: hypothetical protein KC776_07695 [Myxococcales bacterium]|nr:hypothetical protein [Myxococcales bacterium]MCB9583487.1 hypothetical protein [Polyangiaceae bacterium]